MMRSLEEVVLDVLSAMAERMDEENQALAEAYAGAYQAVGLLLLAEEEAKEEGLRALVGGKRHPLADRVRGALESLEKASPADGEVVKELVVAISRWILHREMVAEAQELGLGY